MMRNASPLAGPKRYSIGDPCPIVDRHSGLPCGKPLELNRYGWGRARLRCASWHVVRQCARCGALIPSRARSDIEYCTTRCRVAAHRERSRG